MVSLARLHGAFFGGMLRTRVDRNRAPHPDFVLWVSRGSGVRRSEARVLCGRGSVVQSVKMTSNQPWPAFVLESGRIDSVTSDCCGIVSRFHRYQGGSDDGLCVGIVSLPVGS